MPVSPQDFALWSRMTGNPYPQTPAERMALAPEVYSYTRQVGRQGGPVMSPARRAVDVAGKVALAAGAIAGASYLASKGFQKLDLDNEPGIGSTVAESMPDVTSQTSTASGDITPPTTSDYYGQDVVSNQTSGVQTLRGTTAQKPTLGPIEQKPATQSEVIGSQQYFSPGTEEQQLASSAQPSSSVREQAEELIGRVSAAKLAKFRQSPSYQATVKPIEAEELIGDDTPFVEPLPQPVTVPGPVSPTPKTRIVTTAVEEESPIVSMTTVAAPAAATPSRMTSELAEREKLARTALGHLPLDQAMAVLADISAAKGSKTVSTPAEQTTVVTEPKTTTRVVVPGAVNPPGTTISPNKFLSEMSQQVGPVSTYKISAERSPAVKGLSFYPGGEVGVQMRRGGTGEFAYATADPYRLALSEYAEEGFPSGMGKIGGIVSKAGTAAQLGLQKAVETGGVISESQPPYSGLMDAREIAKKLASKSQRTREQAAYHADTRDIMQTLEQRAAQRRAGLI